MARPCVAFLCALSVSAVDYVRTVVSGPRGGILAKYSPQQRVQRELTGANDQNQEGHKPEYEWIGIRKLSGIGEQGQERFAVRGPISRGHINKNSQRRDSR